MSKTLAILRIHPWLSAMIVPAVLLVAVVGALAAWWLQPAESAVPAMPTSSAIEDKYGIRFTFLAVTADGGLIDLRYRVVDAGKARSFGHYTETAPMLVSEDTGLVVQITAMGLHNHRVETGYTYYVLYRNTASAIKSGSKVTVVIGDLKLEHVPAL
ncbi:MAG: hypothetical protein KKA73_22990 [Chloroflexi bacterium]|nr:hypothetical protein [Chloroflexota bacterium]MBU1750557.1 hypothetical protein [Chloroflexota bacterium]